MLFPILKMKKRDFQRLCDFFQDLTNINYDLNPAFHAPTSCYFSFSNVVSSNDV